MSANHDLDQGAACCRCASCMALGAEGDIAEGRYPIPTGPGIPTGPAIPNPPTISEPPTSPTAPGGSGTDSAGYTGPRYHTLLRGDDWNGTAVGVPAVVAYSFATRSLSNYATGSFLGQAGFVSGQSEALDANQRSSIREALKLWEQASGLFFVEIPDQPEREFYDIRFSLENLDYLGVSGVIGYAEPNSGVYGRNIQFALGEYADDPLRTGTDAFITALHEIGHAIGLKHPFHGTPNLSAAEDNTSNTVMSYTDGRNYTHLGPFDIEAVQHIYGTQAAEDAAPVRWARGPGGSLITTGDDAENLITGLVIRDVVHGNGGGDFIQTLGGDDEITPGAGDDVVFGGGGVDVLIAGALRQQAEIAVRRAGQGTVALPDGTDSFAEIETIRFLDGDLVLGADGAAGQVFRLYGAALGREPDPVGLAHWTSALRSGAVSLPGAVAALTGSAEFAGSYGTLSDAGFVSLLYANVLGREPDAAGLAFWTDAMRAGRSQAEVLLSFSESAEYRARTDGAFAGGVWIADAEAVEVLRAYVAVLDRLPDAGGLAGWIAAREAGLGQLDLVKHFVNSAEFQSRFGGLSNRDFVEQLYRTALDRPADPEGLAGWTRVLDAGIDSRAGVAFGFANSAELAIKVTPMVENGIWLA